MALLICCFAPDRLDAQRTAGSTLRGLDAETLLQQGKPAEALPILNQLHKVQPNNVQVCYQQQDLTPPMLGLILSRLIINLFAIDK